MSFVGDVIGGLFGSGTDPQERRFTTTTGPPKFSPEAAGLLGPLGSFLRSRIPETSEFGGDVDFGPDFSPIFDPAQAGLQQILGGFYDPILNPEGFEAAFSTASAPLIRSFSEEILPQIRSAASRAGVPRGSRVGTATDIASGRLMQALEDLSGNIFASERRFGGDLLSRALGLTPAFIQSILQQEFGPLQMTLDPIFRFLGLTRGPGDVTEPTLFPSKFQEGLSTLAGLTSIGGGIASMLGPLGFGISTEEMKKDISEPLDREDVLEMIQDIPVRTWRYRWEQDDEPVHIGPIIEDLPENFRRGPTLDLGSVLGGTVLALQDLDDRMSLLEV